MYKDIEQLMGDKAERGECTRTWGLKNYPLAMVYAPLQEFDGILDKECALERGSLFEKLDLPFMGASVYKGGNCRG